MPYGKSTKQETSEILLGRPTLHALGLETKEIPAAACRRFNGTIYISKALSSSTTDKTMDASVARIASEGTLHSNCAVTANEDVSNDDEQYVDIGIRIRGRHQIRAGDSLERF